MYGFEKDSDAAAGGHQRNATEHETRRSIVRAPRLADLASGNGQYELRRAEWEHDFADNPDPVRLLNPIASQCP